MGRTFLAIANSARSEGFHTERFLVDSGAVYSVVQRPVLEALGIRQHSRRTFTLANGDQIERHLGDALFRYKEQRAAAGEPGDSHLLGMGLGVCAGSPKTPTASVADAVGGSED